jgi:sialate O-acetylesterase
MKLRVKILSLSICSFVLLIYQAAFCKVKLPVLMSDGMVLQRDANVKIWGWADANEKVAIRNLSGQRQK